MSNKTFSLEAISLDESKRLMGLEKTIQAGVETFVTVGLALEEIRAAKLYRAEFRTFQEYCIMRWNFTKSRAFQLIEAAVTVKSLPAPLSTMVDTERAARALKKVKSGGPKTPEIRRVNKLLEKAIAKKSKVTARDIQTAANKPLPRGGLAADAIRAQRGETEPLMNPVLPSSRVVKESFTTDPITPGEFQKALDLLEARIPEDCNHEKFGVILNKAANRQMNWGIKTSAFAYGR